MAQIINQVIHKTPDNIFSTFCIADDMTMQVLTYDIETIAFDYGGVNQLSELKGANTNVLPALVLDWSRTQIKRALLEGDRMLKEPDENEQVCMILMDLNAQLCIFIFHKSGAMATVQIEKQGAPKFLAALDIKSLVGKTFKEVNEAMRLACEASDVVFCEEHELIRIHEMGIEAPQQK